MLVMKATLARRPGSSMFSLRSTDRIVAKQTGLLLNRVGSGAGRGDGVWAEAL